MKADMSKVYKRVSVLNKLLEFAANTYETAYQLDSSDHGCEFMDELRELMTAATNLENRIMLEAEKIRKQAIYP